MVRTHKRSKITYASIRNGGLFLLEQDYYNPSKYNWENLKEYVLQTELLANGENGCLVEYLEKQDADEYVNEKRYIDEIERLTAELETMGTKLKVVEDAFAEQKQHTEWLINQNHELMKLLEQKRNKQEKRNRGEK